MSCTGTRSTAPLLRRKPFWSRGHRTPPPIIPGTLPGLFRCSRSQDHHGFRGCRPPGLFSRQKRPPAVEVVRSNVVTTTIVPAGGERYIGVNYFSQPSDTLLGILAGLEQIMRADRGIFVSGDVSGWSRRPLVVCRVSRRPEACDIEFAGALQPFDDNGLTALLCDVTAPRSAATDTRAERRRFVTNACVHATFVRGIRLGVIVRIELEGLLGRELRRYKRELLMLFGKHGYIRHSLESDSDPARPPSRWISSTCIRDFGI